MILFALRDGKVVVHTPAEKPNIPKARLAAGDVVQESLVSQLPPRPLRNAWRVNPLTGSIVVDLPAARRIRARQWWSEAKELRAFITDQLLPVARLLRDTVAETRLEDALAQIDAELTDINKRISEMTELELATHKPSWPQLREAS